MILANERGKGNLGCIVSFLVIAALAYVAYKFAPPYVSHYQLKDEMQQIAINAAAGRLSGSARKVKAEITQSVLRKARELEIPLDEEGVTVERTEELTQITVRYTVPVELLTWVYEYHFEFSSRN